MRNSLRDEQPEQTPASFEQLLLEAEAQWSLGDDERAAALLERALAAVWGRPDEVARVSETAARLADGRPSEALSQFAQRAAEGAQALGAHPPSAALSEDGSDEARPTDLRRRLGLVQLAVFTAVVIVVLVVQYFEAVR